MRKQHRHFFIFIGTVASTLDTTKNVASSAVDKGFSLVGTAKGTYAISTVFSNVIVFYHNTF